MESSQQPEKNEFVLKEFVDDLIGTFPEYKEQLLKHRELNIEEFIDLNGKLYAENFFDILYKNDKIFADDVNSCYLPEVKFSELWNSDITVNTKETIWKYLQLIMFSIISKTDNNKSFMENIENFDNLNMNDLSEQIDNTIKNMSGDNLPDSDKINNAMKGILGGKLGDLAKEIVDESSTGIETEDDLNSLMKDPTKLMSLVKNVGEKLDSKIKNGEINENELMSEATDLLGKMNDIPGFGNIKDMMSNLGLNMNNINTSASENKMKQQTSKNKTKERLQNKLKKKKDNKNI
jgi:hypothetical protein